MDFVKDIEEYSAQIIDLTYKKYTEEMSYHVCAAKKTKQGFEQFLNTKMNGINGIDKKVCFSVRLYAHDEEVQKLFSFMQFGIYELLDYYIDLIA